MYHLSESQQQKAVSLVRKFVDDTFFSRYPELKDSTAVAIVDSVAEGLYDTFSDIDIKFIFTEAVLEKHREEFLTYEKEIASYQEMIQYVFRDSYEGLQSLAQRWDNDILAGEFSYSLIVTDPTGRLEKIKKQLQWYPEEIFKKKIRYLFSHIVFQIDHFYSVAAKRHDPFFSLVIKGRLLEIFIGLAFLLNRQYPRGKKIFLYYKELDDCPVGMRSIINQLLKETNEKKAVELAKKGRECIEAYLLEKDLIPQQDDKEWLRYREQARVTFDFPLIPL